MPTRRSGRGDGAAISERFRDARARGGGAVLDRVGSLTINVYSDGQRGAGGVHGVGRAAARDGPIFGIKSRKH
jgi:hypothetical protein